MYSGRFFGIFSYKTDSAPPSRDLEIWSDRKTKIGKIMKIILEIGGIREQKCTGRLPESRFFAISWYLVEKMQKNAIPTKLVRVRPRRAVPYKSEFWEN